MAKLYEEVKVSKLLKDNDTTEFVELLTPASLEEIVQELVGAGTLVEIEKA